MSAFKKNKHFAKKNLIHFYNASYQYCVDTGAEFFLMTLFNVLFFPFFTGKSFDHFHYCGHSEHCIDCNKLSEDALFFDDCI